MAKEKITAIAGVAKVGGGVAGSGVPLLAPLAGGARRAAGKLWDTVELSDAGRELASQAGEPSGDPHTVLGWRITS